MRSIYSVALLFPLVVLPASVQGQSTFSAGVVSGVSQHDLSGTGTQWFSGVRLDMIPASIPSLVLEAGIHQLSYRDQSDEKRRHWFPEISAQLQIPDRTVRPYLGLAAGYSFNSTESAPTLSGTLGSRIEVCPGWLLRLELRIRSVDPWAGTTADWGLGVSRVL